MIIKTVDLITINEASKALKQKDFIYCDGCIYGIDNINGYMTYTYILDKLHDKYNNFLSELNNTITDNEVDLMERNIRNMSARYLEVSNLGIQAKRGRNIESYKEYFDTAS